MRTYFEARLQKAGPQVDAEFLTWIRALCQDKGSEMAGEKIAEILTLVDAYKAVTDEGRGKVIHV